jgi:hypothetical protein
MVDSATAAMNANFDLLIIIPLFVEELVAVMILELLPPQLEFIW